MTHIVEHRSLRYTWELVRHNYIVDLESEIEIHQVEISPSKGNRLIGPPYTRARFFEIEIDQIQKNGTTVFSFRNICPVQVSQKPDLQVLNCRVRIGRPDVTKRIHVQEGEEEIRWLYTDDFFLISLSSGDRHDLGTLLSLIIGKLNMIALSIPTGRRIRSEFENQQKYRSDMNTMFSDGVDGAFRDVAVYRQHGEMTGSEINVSAALLSAEFQDLAAVCASEEGAVPEIPVTIRTPAGPVARESIPAGGTMTEYIGAEPVMCERIPETNPPESVTGSRDLPDSVPKQCMQADPLEGKPPEESTPEDITQTPIFPEEKTRVQTIPERRCSSCGAGIATTTKFCGSCGSPAGTVIPCESPPAAGACSSCGAEISKTTKFCGRCGAAVSISPPQKNAPDFPEITVSSGDNSSPAARPAEGPAVNLKSIRELEDLSWLID